MNGPTLISGFRDSIDQSKIDEKFQNVEKNLWQISKEIKHLNKVKERGQQGIEEIVEKLKLKKRRKNSMLQSNKTDS